MGVECGAYGWEEKCTRGPGSKRRRKKGHLEEVDVDGKITSQDRQRTYVYNVTVRYVRATIVAVEKE